MWCRCEGIEAEKGTNRREQQQDPLHVRHSVICITWTAGGVITFECGVDADLVTPARWVQSRRPRSASLASEAARPWPRTASSASSRARRRARCTPGFMESPDQRPCDLNVTRSSGGWTEQGDHHCREWTGRERKCLPTRPRRCRSPSLWRRPQATSLPSSPTSGKPLSWPAVSHRTCRPTWEPTSRTS